MRFRTVVCCVVAAALCLCGTRLHAACHPAQAEQVTVVYVDAGSNTEVLLLAECIDPIQVDTWYVSWFVGDEPSLWEWYEIQNRASELLYGSG